MKAKNKISRLDKFRCSIDEELTSLMLKRCHHDDYHGGWYYDKPSLREKILYRVRWLLGG